MKRKIRILTFHNAINYGAILQLYALNHYLKDNNYPVEVIDYENKNILKAYDPYFPYIPEKNILKKLIKTIIFYFGIYSRLKRFKKFKNFLKSNFILTEKIKRIDRIDESFTIVVGSDQIWNPLITNFDNNYFLKNFKGRKIAYAASSEMRAYPELLNSMYLNPSYLKEFEKISVREKALNSFLEEHLSTQTELVLDPVFLLEKKTYTKIEKPINSLPKKYLLIYQLAHSKELKEIALIIAKERNLQIIEINTKQNLSVDKHILKDLGPEEFLYCFNNADFILTTSFHGTCFSIIFEKQFYSFSSNISERQRNILNLLSLENRMIDHRDQLCDKEIDFRDVNKRLKDLIIHSKNFIDI